MRKTTVLITVVLALMFAGTAHAALLAESALKNDGFADKFEYYVDVYLVSTGDEDFEVGRAFLTFTYNTDVLSDPLLSLENPDFHANALYNPMVLVDDGASGRVQLQVTASGTTGTILPASEIRLGRITFTIDQTAYKTETAGIDWVDALADTFVEDETGTGIFLLLAPVDLEGNTSLVCLPEISGTPDGTVAVGFSYSFTPTLVQACSADPITFSISNQPSWASFNDETGELYGSPDFTDVGTNSDIVITATDVYTDSTSLTAFDIQVTADCDAPAITGTPEVSIAAGNNYSFTPTATGGCGTLTYEITSPPIWASFDTTTGALTGTPGAADVGTYPDIEISVIDELNNRSSLAAFDIEVCSALQITGTPVTSIAAGDSYSFTPNGTGGCGTLTYSITSTPTWASFDMATGVLTGNPNLADVGTTTGIVIRVTDQNGIFSELAAFKIEVTPGCTAPTISGSPGTSVGNGNSYSFLPTVSNGCGTLIYEIANLPIWASFDTTTGALTGTPGAADVGTYPDIEISVIDELNNSSSLAAFTIEVTDQSPGDGGGGGGGGGCFITLLW